jgi:hypothetical protein
VAVFACFVLTGFIDDTDFALAIPTGQRAQAAILLPGIAQGEEDAIHADVEPTLGFAFWFWQAVVVMGVHILLVLLTQLTADMKGDPLYRSGAEAHVGKQF